MAVAKQTMNIAMMGITGSGKSTFIRVASQLPVEVGHDLYSCTQTVNPYQFDIENLRVNLIDTPGFDDTDVKEADVLRTIADWLDNRYRNDHVKLDGIMYMQNILEPKVTGSSLRQLKMFRELCGVDPLKNVMFVTCRWQIAGLSQEQQSLAEDREKLLRTDPKFWGTMINAGARAERFENSRESALRLIKMFVDRVAVPLQIQSELVDQEKDLLETSAGVSVHHDMYELQKKHEEEMAQMSHEIEEAKKAQDKALHDALAEAREESRIKLDRIRDQQLALEYDARRRYREADAQTQDLQQQNKKLLEQLGAQNMDVAQLRQIIEANEDKLRLEQTKTIHEVLESQSDRSSTESVGKALLTMAPAVGLGVVMVALGMDPSPALGMMETGGA